MWRECTTCHKCKPFYAFRKHKKGTFCLQSRCIECERAYQRSNPELNRERTRVYRERHPDRVKESSKRGYKNTLEKDPDYFKRWRQTNIEKCRASGRKYTKNNPAKIAAKAARRRIKRKNQTAVLTDNEKRMVRVIYTESDSLGSGYVVDHIIPVDLGGSDHPFNLQVISAVENNKKSNRTDYIVEGLKIYWKDDTLIKEENAKVFS